MEERIWHESYDEGVRATVPYEEVPVPDFLKRTAAEYPDRDAIFFMNRALSYGEYKEHADRMATAMSRLGVSQGDKVAIHTPTIPQAAVAYQAAASIGACVVLTNPLYTPREIEHQWNDAGVKLAVTMDFLWDQKVRDMRDKLTAEQFILCSIPEYLKFPLNLLAPLKLKKASPPLYAKVADEPGVHKFKDLLKSTPADPPKVEIAMDDLAVLQYTGGTTGVSKGAMLTHRNLSVNVQQINEWFSSAERGAEVVMGCLPIFHVFGMTVNMNWSIFAGAACVFQANPRDLPGLLKGLSKHKVTIFPAVPNLFNAINNHPGIEGIDLSSIKLCVSGSAPLTADVQQRFETLTDSVIIEGFGMSETSPVATCNPIQRARKLGMVGVPVSDTDAKIVDLDDPSQDKPTGEEGELIIRGPQVMLGYWQRPDETEKTIKDGWLHTGDLAIMDEDGFFKLVGRVKDMINCSGLKVFPDEVDAVLMSHDKVLEAATIGVPDEKRGETVKSFLVMQPGETMTVEEVEAFARENLAAYKVPREVEFIDELPKSTVLKVLRRELRDMELAKRGG
ncbi:MAG: long-chain fatty acid--CoA ligase [Planctomycetes bacterium]|nr:long-chain fatty acid--CoA ligase [Planctomycetota bacterium]